MTEKTTTGRATVGGLLGIHALTSLHPGSGTALGTVDLPVQRERHTRWPNIAGSALKGVIRDAAREKVKDRDNSQRVDADKDATIEAIFGPSNANASAGALSVTDARILAFPVRSFRGVFAWVTCGAVLERLKRDAELAGMNPSFTTMRPAGETGALAANDSPCLLAQDLILEEFEFKKEDGDVGAIAAWIAAELLPAWDSYKPTCERLKKHLVVLTDDWFTHFVTTATEVSARIALDYDTKTVKEGALFYQEFLPTETLFYAVALMNSSRSKKSEGAAIDLLESLQSHLPSVLQIGGDETTGKGYCAVRLNGGN